MGMGKMVVPGSFTTQKVDFISFHVQVSTSSFICESRSQTVDDSVVPLKHAEGSCAAFTHGGILTENQTCNACCGAYTTAVILGCSTDSTECGAADSLIACDAASDEVDETSNTGPIDSTNCTSEDAFVDCNMSSPLVITSKETVVTVKNHSIDVYETATGNKNEGVKNANYAHHTAYVKDKHSVSKCTADHHFYTHGTAPRCICTEMQETVDKSTQDGHNVDVSYGESL